VRIKLFTLTRYFPQLIELIKDIIQFPAFDEQELQVYINNKLERLQIDLKKNEVLAYRNLTEIIFGKKHPYGRNPKPKITLA
jgi:predicted Zn-dependent peptidase